MPDASALLLHIWLIVIVGNEAGGDAPTKSGVDGPLSVSIREATSDERVGLIALPSPREESRAVESHETTAVRDGDRRPSTVVRRVEAEAIRGGGVTSEDEKEPAPVADVAAPSSIEPARSDAPIPVLQTAPRAAELHVPMTKLEEPKAPVESTEPPAQLPPEPRLQAPPPVTPAPKPAVEPMPVPVPVPVPDPVPVPAPAIAPAPSPAPPVPAPVSTPLPPPAVPRLVVPPAAIDPPPAPTPFVQPPAAPAAIAPPTPSPAPVDVPAPIPAPKPQATIAAPAIATPIEAKSQAQPIDTAPTKPAAPVAPAAEPAASLAPPTASRTSSVAGPNTSSTAPQGNGQASRDTGQPARDSTAPSNTAPSDRPLNLELHPRNGPTAGHSSMGLIPLLPAPPERKSKLADDMEKATRSDCKNAYSGAGVLAVAPIVADAVRDKGCRW